MTNRFDRKSVLITGAGGGIGLETVRVFASEGARIVAADSTTDNLVAVESLCRDLETECISLAGDLRDTEYCNSLARRAFEQTGQLDVVVNNAGVMRRGNILQTSDQDWQLLLDVNLTAMFRICRKAIEIMSEAGGGAIVNTASCWGRYSGPDHVAYCTSKAAVAAMTQCLGRDHASAGIRVNAVCPNEVDTPMLRTGFSIRGLDPDSAIDTLNQSVPIGRIANPGEIADAIAFLASDQAAYICGSLLEINGAKPVY